MYDMMMYKVLILNKISGQLMSETLVATTEDLTYKIRLTTGLSDFVLIKAEVVGSY